MESQMLVLYKIKNTSYENYSINIEKIKWHMLDYLESVNTLSREVPNLADDVNVWGLDVYNEVKQYYLYQGERHEHITYADAYCIFEHKRDWLNKLQYLDSHSELKCSCEKAQIFVYLIIKYNLKRMRDTTGLMNDIAHSIDIMNETEKSALNRYYEQNKTIFESL